MKIGFMYFEYPVIANPIFIDQVVVSDDTLEANLEFLEGDDEVVDQSARNKDEGSVDQENVEVNNDTINAGSAEGQIEDNNQTEEPINPSTHEVGDEAEGNGQKRPSRRHHVRPPLKEENEAPTIVTQVS